MVDNQKFKQQLIRSGVIGEIIVGNIYQDKYGVFYTANKERLLCYPKELNHKEYYVAEGCTEIIDGGFNYSVDFDKDGVWCYGNQIKVLHLPSTIEKIGKSALEGCTDLKAICCDKAYVNKLRSILKTYTSYIYINISAHLVDKITTDIYNVWSILHLT